MIDFFAQSTAFKKIPTYRGAHWKNKHFFRKCDIMILTVTVTVTEIKCSSYKMFIVGLMIRVSNNHLMFIQIFSVHNSTTRQVRRQVREIFSYEVIVSSPYLIGIRDFILSPRSFY
jgi:hypothetical protein